MKIYTEYDPRNNGYWVLDDSSLEITRINGELPADAECFVDDFHSLVVHRDGLRRVARGEPFLKLPASTSFNTLINSNNALNSNGRAGAGGIGSLNLNKLPTEFERALSRLNEKSNFASIPQTNLVSPIAPRKPRALRTNWARVPHSEHMRNSTKYKVLAYLKQNEDDNGREDVSDPLMISLNTGVPDFTLKPQLLRWCSGEWQERGWALVSRVPVRVEGRWLGYGYKLTGVGRAWLVRFRGSPRIDMVKARTIWERELSAWREWVAPLAGMSTREELRRLVNAKLRGVSE